MHWSCYNRLADRFEHQNNVWKLAMMNSLAFLLPRLRAVQGVDIRLKENQTQGYGRGAAPCASERYDGTLPEGRKAATHDTKMRGRNIGTIHRRTSLPSPVCGDGGEACSLGNSGLNQTMEQQTHAH
jgi:hypothetical protein